MDSATQHRQRARDALSNLGFDAEAVSSFDDKTLDRLVSAKFDLPGRLRAATCDGLKKAGLAVCFIMSKLQGAVAGPGPGRTTAGGDLGPESAAMAGVGATDALVIQVAKVAKAVKQLKPMLKPLLQRAYGPRSSSSAQSEYRSAALQYYTGEPQPRHATCAVSGVQLPVQDVVAGHIYQRRWPPTKGVKIDDPPNLMLMHREVEQHFNNFVFTVTPVELKVVLLDKKRKDKVLFEYTDDGGRQKSVKLGDLDGRLLAVGRGTAPSEYALSVHAASAFDHALQRQWCSAADIPPTVRCDRELFQGFLRDSASGSSSGSGGGSGGSSGGGSGGTMM